MTITDGRPEAAAEPESPGLGSGPEPEAEPVTTMLRMRVRPGCADEFVRAWHRAAASIADTPGQISQELFRDADDPMTFVVAATWADRGRLDAFGRGADRERLTAALRDLRESAERHTYNSVHRVEGSVHRVEGSVHRVEGQGPR
jgi:quinol monooxygenase YgiN